MNVVEDRPSERTARWYQRVVPVSGLVIALVALAAVVAGPVRDQLSLSLSRVHDPYVELYFARSVPDGGQATCTRRRGRVLVDFVVASHLDRAQRVPWRVEVAPQRAAAPVVRRGELPTTVGRAVGQRTTVPLERGRAYTVTVTLPTLGQQVRAHCGGTA